MEAVKRPAKLTAFRWLGAKFTHLNWLLPLLPKCGHYVEPYGGSGVVLLNREPSRIETLNDLNGDVVNFFKVLRYHPMRLIDALSLTPWSREEYTNSLKSKGGEGPVEKARKFFITSRQGFLSNNSNPAESDWSHNVQPKSDKHHYYPATWTSRIKQLIFVAERLQNVQIECRPALSVIKMYDTPDTLFYCDPPYIQRTRTNNKRYPNETTDEDFQELAVALNECKGKVALSSYSDPFIDDLFPNNKWFLSKEKPKLVYGGGYRQECLYTNYDPKDRNDLGLGE
jgi:DNA adenine methylase